MTRQQSEGEVHVEAMRLILAEMERREDLPDWTIWQHMLNMLETIFQGIEDQRSDDQDELMHTRKELADAQRELSEQSMVANVQTQQDAAAWQQQVDSANAEVSYLRARLDEERSVSARLRQQLDAARVEVETLREQFADAQLAVSDAFADVNSLRQQLDAARADNVEIRKRLNDETDRHNKTNAEKVDLFQKLEWASKHCAELVKERDAARAAVTLQRAGIERLALFVWKVREAVNLRSDVGFVPALERVMEVLAELDAGTEPAPVAEPRPCPECERLRAELETANEHRTDLLLFVDNVRKSFRVWGGDESFFHSVSHALDQLDTNSSVTLTSSPTPVAEPLDAEGGQ